MLSELTFPNLRRLNGEEIKEFVAGRVFIDPTNLEAADVVRKVDAVAAKDGVPGFDGAEEPREDEGVLIGLWEIGIEVAPGVEVGENGGRGDGEVKGFGEAPHRHEAPVVRELAELGRDADLLVPKDDGVLLVVVGSRDVVR